MRVVLSWLRELCPVRATPEELAELLTARGAKVEAILRPWESLSGVLVARVVEVSDHPNSDKLCLARVTFGSGERVLVVGVRNMAPGDLVPLAGPGASVPALAQPLAAREIRGVVSEGMLCSPYELGIAQDHSGILLLPEDTEPGDDVKEALGLDEAVFDIEVTPNRPDLMSVVGVAREASAATGVPLESPQSDLREEAETAASAAGIEIRDRERCPRYLARVIRGVSHGPSPVRKRARLTAAGMRPISAIVDATNYAMLEFGHPMHAFDLDLLEGAAIVVRRAEEGEELTTLDGVGRKLSGDDLLIADSASGLAVAGVMGGTRAEVSDETRDVLLESAYFQPGGVLRTSRRLGLSSEASMRFERGTDPEALAPAADRACALLSEWAGGRILAGRLDEGETPVRRRVSMRVPRAAALLGHPVSQADAVGSLEKLGFEVDTDDDQVTVEVPGFRVDIEREVDLIEEVARVQGYELIGSTMPPVRQAGGLPGSYAFVGRVRRSLVRAGLREVRLIPFTSERDLAMFGDGSAVRVANPLDAEQAFLRTRLAPGLVAAVGRNLARNSRSVALFEVGTVFRLSDPLHEGRKVGAVMAGSSPSWWKPERAFDVFDAKGVLEALMGDLGIRSWTLEDPPDSPFHPSRSASVVVAGEIAGEMGELRPDVVRSLDLAGRVALLELDVDILSRVSSRDVSVVEVPRFPPLRRDLAFIVDATVPALPVREAIAAAGGSLVVSCLLFDVFTGSPLPEGKKSLAFSLDLRASDRTLTDQEADRVVEDIVRDLTGSFGAELRAGG